MTPDEAKQHRKKLHREIANELRAKDRIKLHQLDEHIRRARTKRRAAVVEARKFCKRAREQLRERQQAEREAFKVEQRRIRLEGRSACLKSREAVNVEGKTEIAKLQLERRGTAAEQRNIARAGKAHRSVRSTARERGQESDDSVRRDIPSELVPVFNKVRASIKGSARRTRAEAFLEWAHENPDEIVSIQQRDADKYLESLVREQREHRGKMRKAGRYKLSEVEVAKRLADVPF